MRPPQADHQAIVSGGQVHGYSVEAVIVMPE